MDRAAAAGFQPDLAGCRFGQVDHAVAVKRAAIVDADHDASVSISATDGVDEIDANIKAKESFGAAARFGVKVNNATGIYARVGWLSTNFKATIDDGVDAYSDSESEDAIQYGVGLETMIAEAVTLRAEYLRASYGDQGIDGLSIDNNNFKAGLAFRF